MYIGYYAKADNQKYSYDQNEREDPNRITLKVLDWENEPSEDFVPNYIRVRGLKYSCGFALFDLNGNYRTIISLDRVEKKKFSQDELMNLYLAIPQLNHLHKNFYYQWFHLNALKRATMETENLTAREAEIANLLCQGVSPANISRTLCIAPATTNKHIAHIYEKLHVSSERELLVRLLRQPTDPLPG
jgi:DNA-binding CsgD family transcriptional regulator